VAIATENETFHRFLAYSSLAMIAVYISALFAKLE
jgi:hypothetical protein